MIKKKNEKKITTQQHFAALLHTSSNYTSLHLTTLHSLTITLLYPLICLNTFTFPTAIITFPTALNHISYLSNHISYRSNISLNCSLYSSPISKLISKKKKIPFTALKNRPPFHFNFFRLSDHSLTSLYFPIHIHNSHPFTSFPNTFTFYRLHFPSLVFTILTLVLKIRVLPLEISIALSGSLFQSVMDQFTKEYFPMSYVF